MKSAKKVTLAAVGNSALAVVWVSCWAAAWLALGVKALGRVVGRGVH